MLLRLAETLAVAAVGGLALGYTGLPAGYLSGAILLVAGFALAGRPMLVPTRLTQAIFILIGMSLGAVVTPATLQGVTSYPLSVVALLVAMVFTGMGGAGYLRAVHGWNVIDAYLASAPGAMSQVLAVSIELKADIRGVAIVQSLRIVIIAVGLPASLGLLGLAGEAPRPVVASLSWAALDELAILMAVSTVSAVLAYKLRMPGGLLFGAMFASAALHGGGWIQAALPWWVANTAMIAIGAVTGARFASTPAKLLLRYLGAGFGCFAVSAIIAALFAIGVSAILPLRSAEVIIAYAPGSVDAMMLLALALHLDPVYVGVHHVIRIIQVAMTVPLVARRMAHKPKRVVKTDDTRPQPPFQD